MKMQPIFRVRLHTQHTICSYCGAGAHGNGCWRTGLSFGVGRQGHPSFGRGGAEGLSKIGGCALDAICGEMLRACQQEVCGAKKTAFASAVAAHFGFEGGCNIGCSNFYDLINFS
ncbi:hypothetical protein Ancab_026469 [Ancistrocladus abbreviatus]